MHRPRQHTTLLAVFLASGSLAAATNAQRVPDIPERAAGAARVVVATVATVEPRMQRNEFGDQLIVSRVTLRVEETLKGKAEETAALDVEGGTINGVTMHVSSLPSISRGERGVFFLEGAADGVYRPHLRGLGILKLDAANTVQGSSLTLERIRELTRGPESR